MIERPFWGGFYQPRAVSCLGAEHSPQHLHEASWACSSSVLLKGPKEQHRLMTSLQAIPQKPGTDPEKHLIPKHVGHLGASCSP